MIYSIAFNAKWSLKIKSLDYLRLRPPFGPKLVWISQAIARSSIWPLLAGARRSYHVF
jgi:hypothetical protein